jgi:hypothetical protein
LTPRETLSAKQTEHAARSKPIKSETDLKAAIVAVLNARGYWAYVLNSGQILLRGRSVRLMPAGCGDVQVLLYGGRVGFLEVKLPGEKQLPSEFEWQRRCQDHNVFYAVVESIDDALLRVSGWAAD